MASEAGSSSTLPDVSTSDYLQAKKTVLKKKQVQDIVRELKALDSKDIIERVKGEVSAGHHFECFPERRRFWDACVANRTLDGFVGALFQEYTTLLGQCFKGREKYAKFQLQWMELVRVLIHKPASHPVGMQWGELVKKAGDPPSSSTKGAVIISLCRAVFDVCQQQIVAFKEGKTLLLEHEQDLDPIEEADIQADAAALFRMGGFALFSALKHPACEEKREILECLRLPLEEKTDLPSNIERLDKGNLTLMKKEMLGYLSQVHTMMREKTSAEYARRHGADMMKVMEEELKRDDHLRKSFLFGCTEIGIKDPKRTALLPEIHQVLLVKMIHTHGNEILENRRMLGNTYSGVVVEVPLMLRDSLKVLAAKHKSTDH